MSSAGRLDAGAALASSVVEGADEGAGFDAAGLPVDHWYGAVDDVRVWSDVRTEAEIANTRCDAPDTSDPALLAWWPLEGDTLDETGNGNDGTAVGALSFFGR